MTQLFSTGARTRKTSRRYNEPIYQFLDTSAWPSVERIREFWEGWFAEYDSAKQGGLAARFQSFDQHQHLSALLELFSFAVLRRLGYETDIEPEVGSKALEFLATKKDDPELKFYVECTATGQRAADVGGDARELDILEAVDQVPSGRFLLQIEFRKRGPQTPSAKRLRNDLGSWLASLDHASVLEGFRRDALTEWIWSDGDWEVKFAAFPVEINGDDEEGALGMIGPKVFDRDEHLRLRVALDHKASKYGDLSAPLLVFTNSTQYQRDRDLMIAVLGDLVWDVDLRKNHVTERFKLNGVFGSVSKPRNVVLSAMIHGNFHILSFADRPMVLLHHPFATNPIPLGLFPFCEERHFDSENGDLITAAPTVSVGEFFGLPSGWPFFEQDPD